LSPYLNILRTRYSAELFRHSLGVAETAADLAAIYRADEAKAYLAGLLHDYVKEVDPELLLEQAKHLKISVDPVTWSERHKLLHAPVGAALLEKELGVDDPEILQAVSLHTTGKPGMSVLEKVIYLADLIEPNREFDGVDRLRKMSRICLDQAVLAAVNITIYLVLNRNLLLHPNSVNLRNELIVCLNKKMTGVDHVCHG